MCKDLCLSISDEHSPPPHLVQQVDAPPGVGESAAQQRASGSIKDLSFAHLKTELRNIFSAMRTKRQSTDSGLYQSFID